MQDIDFPSLHELYQERAAILEFDAGMTRADAERRAAFMVAETVENWSGNLAELAMKIKTWGRKC